MAFQGSLPSHRQERKVLGSETLIAGYLVGSVVSRSLEASQTIGCAACLSWVPGIQVHTLHCLIRLAHLIPGKLMLSNTEVNIGCSGNIQDCVFSTCLHWVALRTLLSVSSPLPLRGFHNGIKTHRLVFFAFPISTGGFLFYPDKKCP